MRVKAPVLDRDKRLWRIGWKFAQVDCRAAGIPALANSTPFSAMMAMFGGRLEPRVGRSAGVSMRDMRSRLRRDQRPDRHHERPVDKHPGDSSAGARLLSPRAGFFPRPFFPSAVSRCPSVRPWPFGKTACRTASAACFRPAWPGGCPFWTCGHAERCRRRARHAGPIRHPWCPNGLFPLEPPAHDLTTRRLARHTPRVPAKTRGQ